MQDEEFDRLLKITRLKLSDEEKSKIKKDIEEVLKYFDAVNSIDVNELPAYQPIEVEGKLREDIVKEFKDTEQLLNGTKLHDSYVQGPKL